MFIGGCVVVQFLSFHLSAFLVIFVVCAVFLGRAVLNSEVMKLNINVEPDICPFRSEVKSHAADSIFKPTQLQLTWRRGAKKLPLYWDAMFLHALRLRVNSV